MDHAVIGHFADAFGRLLVGRPSPFPAIDGHFPLASERTNEGAGFVEVFMGFVGEFADREGVGAKRRQQPP